MILTCSSCSKKFVVPDSAISVSGRMVQCGSCGNKWKQYPIDIVKKASATPISQITKKKIQTQKKAKKKVVKKPREINLYSPEYLKKKHGITINDLKSKNTSNENKIKKISFGFYNSILLFTVLVIFFSRLLYFSQDLIISKFPITEYYLNYFFESMQNIFEIWKNLITY